MIELVRYVWRKWKDWRSYRWAKDFERVIIARVRAGEKIEDSFFTILGRTDQKLRADLARAYTRQGLTVDAMIRQMIKHGESISKALEFVFMSYSNREAYHPRVIIPVVLQYISEPPDMLGKVKKVFEVIQHAEGNDWSKGEYGDFNPIEYIPVLLSQGGLTIQDVIALLYKETGYPFIEIIDRLPVSSPLDTHTVAELAHQLEVDFQSQEEVESIGNSGLDFLYLARILKDDGRLSAEDAVECLSSDIGWSVEVDDALEEMVKAGFPADEILYAFEDQMLWEYEVGGVVETALSLGVSEQDVVKYLQKMSVDPEDLYEMLSTDTDIEFRTRLSIVHKVAFSVV